MSDAPAAGSRRSADADPGGRLNHIDVWGWRGMAFAKRKLPIIVGVEAAGEIVASGRGHLLAPWDRAAPMARRRAGTARLP